MPGEGSSEIPTTIITVCVLPFSRHGAILVGYKYRAAPGMATTSNRDNETPVQPQSERDKPHIEAKPSQAMGAADQ